MTIGGGRLIAVEGADGAGTTTVARRLVTRLMRETSGIILMETNEPSSGPIGMLIREILSKKKREVGNPAMELLFRADRIDHGCCMEGVLLGGQWVVTDRYYPSTLVYQTVGNKAVRGKEADHMRKMFRTFVDVDAIMLPDITLFLEADLEEMKRRREDRDGEAEIYEVDEFQAGVARLYSVWAQDPYYSRESPVVTIDANQEIARVCDDCWEAVMTTLRLRAGE